MREKILIVLILLLSIVSSLEITEIESNPKGRDVGNEWIEIYSEKEINLSNYSFYNNDGEFIVINETIEGYFTYSFEKQFLDNSDEKVMIYLGEELIFESPIFDDPNNDNLTYSYCLDEWKFLDASPDNLNCEEIIQEEIKKKEEREEDKQEKEEQEENEKEEKIKNFTKEDKVNKTLDMIYLNPKTIKKEESFQINTDYTKYSIFGFCILLVSLYIIKPKKKKKNEFTKKINSNDGSRNDGKTKRAPSGIT